MREIKFKGKRESGEWVCGHYYCDEVIVESTFSRTAHFIKRVSNGWFVEKEVDPETVGQFTGSQDKEGKDIYAGDVVQAAHGKCLVKWNENRSAFMLYDLTDELYMMNMEPYLARHVAVYGVEILGNIHDNPELVK